MTVRTLRASNNHARLCIQARDHDTDKTADSASEHDKKKDGHSIEKQKSPRGGFRQICFDDL
mgnify:CR=1 FL=1